jgi:hypothetical protein
VISQESLRRFDHVRIERAGKSLVRADENDEIFFIAACIEKRMRNFVRDLRTQSAENFRTSFERTDVQPSRDPVHA